MQILIVDILGARFSNPKRTLSEYWTFSVPVIKQSEHSKTGQIV
jgi:hypothetical protein